MADRPPDSPSPDDEPLRRRVKVELRKRMRALRNTLPASACAERSARIVLRLLSLEPIERAGAVALFWPIEDRHEVDLRPLDVHLRRRGVRIAYPARQPGTRALTFRFVREVQAMREATGQPAPGLLEPAPDEPEARPGELAVIIVPALAVDPTGQRIGYGAGHYDATLPEFAPPATTVVVAFDFQLIAEVPSTEGDFASRWVVTDARSIDTLVE
jgi:5-formyltetrahydrofolate cyclo-ligase